MTTAQEVFNIAMSLVDEVLDTGQIDPSSTASYSAKTPSILNLLQAELIKQGDLFSTYEISNYPVTNLLGFITNFDVKQYEGTELTYEATGVAKSYYFEVDRPATVYVEDFVSGTWNTLATINAIPTESGYTAFKGLVTPTIGATKCRLRFVGDYYYRTINRALFGASFASMTDIPDYEPWVPVTMPDDFKSVNEVIEEFPERQYTNQSNYKWEGRNKLFVNYYVMGKIRVIYRPIPVVITKLTDVMQLDDVTCRTIVPYGLAAHLMLEENSATASYFNGRYQDLKTIAGKQPPSAMEQITNVYGTFN